MREIKDFLAESVEEGVFPGAVYAIGSGEKVLEQGCVGTLGQGREKVNMDTLYDLASLTKPLCCLALMKQFEEGAWRLEDRIDRFLPDYNDHSKGGITLFQLLTHTSVIPGQVQLYRTCHTKEELLLGIKHIPPRDTAAKPVEYSSQGLILIGEIIEKIFGAPLDKAMKALVFDPLEMASTCYNPPEELWGNTASTEDCPWRGRVVVGQVHDENAVVLGGVCAHAGLFSTVGDIAKAGRAMLTGQCPSGAPFFHKSTLKLMTRNHTPTANESKGLGWFVKGEGESSAGDLFSSRSFGHTGFTGTSLWVDPEQDLYAVLLTNRVHPTRQGEGIGRTRAVFHNLAVLRYR